MGCTIRRRWPLARSWEGRNWSRSRLSIPASTMSPCTWSRSRHRSSAPPETRRCLAPRFECRSLCCKDCHTHKLQLQQQQLFPTTKTNAKLIRHRFQPDPQAPDAAAALYPTANKQTLSWSDTDLSTDDYFLSQEKRTTWCHACMHTAVLPRERNPIARTYRRFAMAMQDEGFGTYPWCRKHQRLRRKWREQESMQMRMRV